MPCLVCQQYSCGRIQRPIEGHVLAPFVEIGFDGEAGKITVGNNSSPPDNHAVIKSFEYGCTEGQVMKCEIFDEDGGDFTKFTERLSKTLARAGEDYRMVVDFGWIIKKCDGTVRVESVKKNGGQLTFLPIKCDVAYEQGKLKFTIEGTDFMDRINENRIEDNQGSEDQKKPLKQAIKDVFAENDPKVTSIRYLRRDGTEPWDFSNADGGPQGPKAVWTCDQQNALATVRKWISPLRTKDDKGIVIEWNCAADQAELILWEGPDPCKPDGCCIRNLGTYIVNGGKCSPVISFNPSLSWVLFNNDGSGGAGASATDGGHAKAEGADCPGGGGGLFYDSGKKKGKKKGKKQGREKVGIAKTTSGDSNTNQWRSNAQIVPKAMKADAAHSLAVKLREQPGVIEADLKIQGNPNLVLPIKMHGQSISIIVINPFHVKSGGGGSCGEWLAEPPCNKLFSNKNWRIAGVNHQIQEGNYVTTLKIRLDTPNSDLNPNEPLGGCPPAPTFDNATP